VQAKREEAGTGPARPRFPHHSPCIATTTGMERLLELGQLHASLRELEGAIGKGAIRVAASALQQSATSETCAFAYQMASRRGSVGKSSVPW
jgi:hypothetical protein